MPDEGWPQPRGVRDGAQPQHHDRTAGAPGGRAGRGQRARVGGSARGGLGGRSPGTARVVVQVDRARGRPEASAAAAATVVGGVGVPHHAAEAGDRRGEGAAGRAAGGPPGRRWSAVTQSLTSSSGARSRVAWASPLAALVTPGPRVTTATPGVPVSSPKAPAITQAAVSPWARVNGRSGAAPIRSRFGPPPGSPNNRRTPARRRPAVADSASWRDPIALRYRNDDQSRPFPRRRRRPSARPVHGRWSRRRAGARLPRPDLPAAPRRAGDGHRSRSSGATGLPNLTPVWFDYEGDMVLLNLADPPQEGRLAAQATRTPRSCW